MRLKLIVIAAMLAACGARAATVAATDSHIARMGRAVEDADGGLRFGYPGVRLSFSFTGKALSVDAWSSGKQSYLDVVIDGAAPRRIAVPPERTTLTLVDAATAGHHSVDIMHRSETWNGVVTLAGFATDGALDAAPPLPRRKLLVLGDSVTCAEGVDRAGIKKDATWTDPRHSYGMLMGEALDAQVQLVCYGGRGLVRSWNGRTDELNLPDFYQLGIADAAHPQPWDQRRYQPDLIVSAIGTNDFTTGIPEREAYVTVYVALVRTLLRDHPQARIALTEGAILNGAKKAALSDDIAETVRRVGDPRVRAVASAYHPGDASDAHPTGAQHAQMAQELLPQLRALAGWQGAGGAPN